MFVDICFPNKKEIEFLNIAEKLGIEGICFIYEKETDFPDINLETPVKIYRGLTKNKRGFFSLAPLTHSLEGKNTHYYVKNIFERKSFHYPIKINQVVIRKIREKRKMIGISFNELLNLNSDYFIEQLKFIIKMCRKYKVKMFIASFATHPLELRSPRELCAVSRLLGLNTKEAKESIESLSHYLEFGTAYDE